MTVTAEPELVRISILGASTQVDVALPTQAPIAALIPEVLRLLRIPEPVTDDPDRIAELPRWTLTRIGAPPLPVERSLAEAQVVDGELLLLHDDVPDTPGALVDDVIDGLAHLTDRRSSGWSADSARLLGYATCATAALVAAITGRAAPTGTALTGLSAAACAAFLVVAALMGSRLHADPRGTATLSWCAFVAAALAGSFVPPQDSSSSVVTSSLCALTSVLIVHRGTGVGPQLHAFLGTLAGLTAVCGLAAMALTSEWSAVAPVTAVVGLFVTVSAARIAIAASRLPLPPVPSTPPSAPATPTTDPPIDGIDAVAPDPVEAIADLALVDLADLQRRSALATDYLTGIVLGAVTVIVVAVLTTALTYDGEVKSLLFCGAIGAALLARGRTHADRIQSAALLTGGTGCALAVLAGGSPPALFFGGIAVAATAFVIGSTAEGHDFSPLQRRTLEIAEYAVIALIVPLLLWLLDAYRVVREL